MKKYVYGMADDRDTALKKLQKKSESLSESVTSCVIYGLNCNAYNHWNTKIVDTLCHAGNVSVSGKGKFDLKTYRHTTFKYMGDSYTDAKDDLEDYLDDIKRGKKQQEHNFDYPEFEITKAMINALHSVRISIIQEIGSYFESLPKYGRVDINYIKRTIHNIFESSISW